MAADEIVDINSFYLECVDDFHEIAKKKGLKLIICNGLYRVLNKEISPEDFMNELYNQGKKQYIRRKNKRKITPDKR